MDQISVNRYEPVLTIGIAANKLGISVQSLRLYEQEGLIIPHKTASGRRMYSFHDIDRLTCIREMLTTHGLNMSGIKRLMSMIPCWDYKGGLDNDCVNCSAYYEAHGPCWTVEKVGAKCETTDCRTCPVYRVEINCNKMKEIIFGHSRPK